jgi:outer membrane protein, heavy metal efflux system
MESTMRPLVFAVILIAPACASTSPRYDRLRRSVSAPIESLPSRSDRRPQDLLDDTPVFEQQPELVLEHYLAEVLERNPTLSAARQALEAAVARYPQVTALDDPTFTYAVAPNSAGADALDFAQRITFSQRLPWPGKLQLRGDRALSEAEATREDLRVVRDQLVREAKSAFVSFYFVYRAIEINEVNKAILLEFQRMAETRYAAGTASKQDALQAEVAYDHLLHRGIVLERQRRVGQGRLNALLNRAPTAELPPPPQTLDPPGERRPLEELLDRSLEGRPELAALVRRLEAQEVDLKLARKEFYPDFTVSGGYNSFWRRDELRPSVGFGINIPLQRGRRDAAVEQATAGVLRLRARIADLTARVALEVQESYELVVEAEHVVHLYQSRVVPTAQENLDAGRTEYSAGEIDFLSLLTAERSLMEAQLAHQKGLAAYHQRRADLERAVGLPFGLAGLEDGRQGRLTR